MSNPDPLEKDIESKVREFAMKQGCLVYKFTSPAKRSVPDRMFVNPGGRVWFIEFKRKGEKPTPAQAVEIAKLQKQGVSVYVVDNVATGKQVVDSEMML